MTGIKIFIEKNYKIVVCLFFAIYLCVGISIFKDYGISTDENTSRTRGINALNHIIKTVKGEYKKIGYPAKEGIDWRAINNCYGPAFEILLAATEKILNLKDSRTIYLMRHLATFLMFYTGVYFFYLLCKYRFSSWKIGLLGSLFIILSPRIFAESFYNPKNIPFLTMFIISIYTLLRYLDKKTLLKVAIHAITCAFLIDISIAGIIIPFLTIIFVFSDLFVFKNAKAQIVEIITSLAMYISLLIFFIILFWPFLWESPFNNFINAIKLTRHFPWHNYTLYLGNHFQGGTKLPWHYIPLWLTITTPLLYIFCFLIGIFLSAKSLLSNPINFYSQKRNDLIFMLCLFVPVAVAVGFNYVLYNAWRHMYFIYPGFLMLSLIGLTSLFGFIKIRFKGFAYITINTIFSLIIFISLIDTAQSMVKYHPYENIYFNSLTGGIKGAKGKFDLGYWGLSYRQELEYILKTDTSNIILFNTFTGSGQFNKWIIPYEDRERLVYVGDINKAKYFLTNFRGGRPLKWYMDKVYPYEKYYSVEIEGTEIMAVYKIN